MLVYVGVTGTSTESKSLQSHCPHSYTGADKAVHRTTHSTHTTPSFDRSNTVTRTEKVSLSL